MRDPRRRRDDLITTGVVALGLLVLGIALRIDALVWASAGIGAAAVASRALAAALASGWRKLGHATARVNGAVLLALVFVLVLTPLALLRRALGMGRGGLAGSRGRRSLWIERNHAYGAEDLERTA